MLLFYDPCWWSASAKQFKLLTNFLPVLCSNPTIPGLRFAQTKQSIFWGVGQKVAIVKENVYQILKGGGGS